MSRDAASLKGQGNETKIQVNFLNELPFVTHTLSDFDFEFMDILEMEKRCKQFNLPIIKQWIYT